MTLALLLAGGVALAATFTCKVGVTCNGTSSADTITGTTSNDTINGLAGKDIIKARDGIDKINGGTQNDEMNGGPGNDTYKFSNNLGADRISADSGGVDTLNFAALTSSYTNGLLVPLTADGSTLCDPKANPCLSLFTRVPRKVEFSDVRGSKLPRPEQGLGHRAGATRGLERPQGQR